MLRMNGSYAVLRNEQQNSYSASRASMDLLLEPGDTDDETSVHGKLQIRHYNYHSGPANTLKNESVKTR